MIGMHHGHLGAMPKNRTNNKHAYPIKLVTILIGSISRRTKLIGMISRRKKLIGMIQTVENRKMLANWCLHIIV